MGSNRGVETSARSRRRGPLRAQSIESFSLTDHRGWQASETQRGGLSRGLRVGMVSPGGSRMGREHSRRGEAGLRNGGGTCSTEVLCQWTRSRSHLQSFEPRLEGSYVVDQGLDTRIHGRGQLSWNGSHVRDQGLPVCIPRRRHNMCLPGRRWSMGHLRGLERGHVMGQGLHLQISRRRQPDLRAGEGQPSQAKDMPLAQFATPVAKQSRSGITMQTFMA